MVAPEMKISQWKKPFSARIVPRKPKEVAKILHESSIKAVDTASCEGYVSSAIYGKIMEKVGIMKNPYMNKLKPKATF
jgi:hypothetical protein